MLTTAVAGGLLCMATFTTALASSATASSTPRSDQTETLCLDAAVACSVQVEPALIEGSTREVAVTGRAGVTVEVQAYRVTLDGAKVTAVTPYGASTKVTTDSRGFGAGSLAVPALPDGQAGGPLLVALGDVEGTDLSAVLGTWSVLASRNPHLQGDGYGTEKPVGQTLDLVIDAAVPGTDFDVELDDAGTWVPVGVGEARCTAADAPCTVSYALPRGLRATTYTLRLLNLTTGTPVATWTAIPSADGAPKKRSGAADVPAVGAGVPHSVTYAQGATSNAVPRPRQQNLDTTDLGSGTLGASGSHSPRTVMLLAGGAAALAVTVAALAVATGIRRLDPVRDGGRRG